MPGVKANTQSKGKEKEKVGGGGAAGIKARTGGGETRDCFVCVPSGETRHCAPRARRARVGAQRGARRARTRVLSQPKTMERRPTHSRAPALAAGPRCACSCKVKFNIRTPKAQLQEVGAGGTAGALLLCGLAGRAAPCACASSPRAAVLPPARSLPPAAHGQQALEARLRGVLSGLHCVRGRRRCGPSKVPTSGAPRIFECSLELMSSGSCMRAYAVCDHDNGAG